MPAVEKPAQEETISCADESLALAHTEAVKADVPLLSATIESVLVAQGDLSLPNAVFQDLPLFDTMNPLEWRIEVTNNGKNWNWRKGSGSNRVGRYGGIFGLLSEERKDQYVVNKRKYARSRKKAKAATSTAEQKRRAQRPTNRTQRVSARRDHTRTSTEQSGIVASA